MVGLISFWHAVLEKAPLTVVVVGDFDREAVIALLARTVGSLTPREAMQALAPARPFDGGIHEQLAVPTTARHSEVRFSIAMPDMDSGRDPSIEILPRILGDRLRVRLREQLAETYAPDVRLQAISIRGASSFTEGIVRVAAGH